MTKTAESLVVLATTVILAGCAGGTVARTTAAAEPTPPVELPAYVAACPLSHLRGVRAEAADVPGGVAVVFGGPDRVLFLLRANVRAMASASATEGNPFAICPCRDIDPDGSVQATRATAATDLGATMMQPSSSVSFVPPEKATVSETPTGATLVLTGADDSEVALLRSETRHAVGAMGECLAAGRY